MATSDKAQWSYIIASGGARSIWEFEVGQSLSDGIVTLVGNDMVGAGREPSPQEVFAVDVPSLKGGGAYTRPSASSSGAVFPAGARWPDTNGRIETSSLERPKVSGAVQMRNPWAVRTIAKAIVKEIHFECEGIVTGGEGGSVAILNGRVVRLGDFTGVFKVAGILPCGVMIERNGLYLVIPMGRPATVEIVDS